MHLKLAVVLMFGLIGTGMTWSKHPKSSISSSSSSSSSSKETYSNSRSIQTYGPGSSCRTKTVEECEKCCCDKPCRSCQLNSHGNWWKCEKVFCNELKSPVNGSVDYESPRFRCDSRVTYACDTGYELSGKATRYCLQDGSWSGHAPRCLVFCNELEAPAYGSLDYENRRFKGGSRVTYACVNGYELSGNDTRYCLQDGSWSGNAPSCLAICPELCPPRNGYVTVDSRLQGSIANYSCDDGYELNGPDVRTCLPDRSWDEYDPICVQTAMCPDLCPPRNGDIHISDRSVGSMLSYTCDLGYKLDGPENRTCQTDGTWDKSDPICQPTSAMCPDLCPPRNGDIHISDRSVGSMLNYTCDLGYKLDGPENRTCQTDGTWDKSAPICSSTSDGCGYRWFKVYSHDNTGNKISGNKDELEEAVLTGALIKVNLYDQYYLQVQTAYVIDGNVCGQIKAAIAHQDYDTFAVSVATYLEDLT